jgi:hypothetical protein
MGLDQEAYSRGKEDQSSFSHYWRKHNRLQGWMENLWEEKGRPNSRTENDPMGDFNCVELELTREDIDLLEEAVNDFALPETQGFFFGDDSYFYKDDNGESLPENDYYHKEQDLQFIEDAKKALDKGEKVYYSSWY